MYKLLETGGVIRLSDGGNIPETTDNKDWREYQKWVSEGNTAEPADIADPMLIVRTHRDRKLRDSDWTQLPDAGVNKAPYVTYRQELRDLPQNQSSVTIKTVIWPTKP